VSMLLALLLLAAPQQRQTAAASPDDPAPIGMSVATFLSRWDAVVAAKQLNMANPETRQLAAEITSTGKAYRDLIDAQAKAGRPQRGCPARGTTLTMESDEVLASFRAMPQAARGVSVRDAMFAIFDKRYPCGAG
jgi:hypothetical protein